MGVSIEEKSQNSKKGQGRIDNVENTIITMEHRNRKENKNEKKKVK